MNIREATKQWERLDDWIRESCERLWEVVNDIDYELGDEYLLDYPDSQEDLVSFEVNQNSIMTHWEYVDDYEDICDSSSSWSVHFEWFDMSKEELKEVLIEQAKYRHEKLREREVNRIKYEASRLGLEVLGD